SEYRIAWNHGPGSRGLDPLFLHRATRRRTHYSLGSIPDSSLSKLGRCRHTGLHGRLRRCELSPVVSPRSPWTHGIGHRNGAFAAESRLDRGQSPCRTMDQPHGLSNRKRCRNAASGTGLWSIYLSNQSCRRLRRLDQWNCNRCRHGWSQSHCAGRRTKRRLVPTDRRGHFDSHAVSYLWQRLCRQSHGNGHVESNATWFESTRQWWHGRPVSVPRIACSARASAASARAGNACAASSGSAAETNYDFGGFHLVRVRHCLRADGRRYLCQSFYGWLHARQHPAPHGKPTQEGAEVLVIRCWVWPWTVIDRRHLLPVQRVQYCHSPSLQGTKL